MIKRPDKHNRLSSRKTVKEREMEEIGFAHSQQQAVIETSMLVSSILLGEGNRVAKGKRVLKSCS